MYLNPVRAKSFRVQSPIRTAFTPHISRKKDDCVYPEVILAMNSKEKQRSRKKYWEFAEIGLIGKKHILVTLMQWRKKKSLIPESTGA